MNPVRSRNVDYMSISSASTNSHLVRLASYDIEGQMSSNSSWRTYLAQAQSSEEEEPKTRQYSITVHDPTDSESMASTEYSYRNNVVEINCSDLARADKQIQKKGNSLMSSFWSCLNPKLQGEMGIKHTIASKSQVFTMRALSSNEDALDRVFNTLEGFTCQDDNDLVDLRERGIIGTREQPNMAEIEDLQDYIDQNTSKWKKKNTGTRSLSGKNGIERDILDNAFEKIEKMTCQDHGDNSTLVPYESDLLDSVFEGLERVACRDDYEEERLQRRQASPAARLPEGRATAMPSESDMLDRVFEGFEHTMCHGDGVANVGSEANMLDDVSERLEYTVYREPAPGRNGVRSHEPIDLTAYSLDLQNSIVDRSPVACQESEWRTSPEFADYESERRVTLLQGKRKSSRKKVSNQLQDQENRDMLDVVFENFESALCHDEYSAYLDDALFQRAQTTRRVYSEDPRSLRRIYFKDE